MTSQPLRARLRRLLAGDLQILVAGNAVESALRFAAFVIYSRELGVGGFGLVATTLALVHLTSQVFQPGIDTAVISLGSKSFGRGDTVAVGCTLSNSGSV